MTRYIEMALCKDGYTASDFRKAPLPDEGDYGDPMPTWKRNGAARQFQPMFRCTEPCVVTLIAIEMQGS